MARALWLTLVLFCSVHQAEGSLLRSLCTTALHRLDHIYRSIVPPYILNRGYRSYAGILGPDFAAAVRRARHWLDVGAGKAAAMREFWKTIRQLSGTLEDTPLMTAVGLREPWSPALARFKKACLSFRYLEGEIETIPGEKIGKADLITDVYGALSYTKFLDVTLQKYLDLLELGGELHAILLLDSVTISPVGLIEHNPHQSVKILLPDGSPLSVEEYLRMTTGVEVFCETVEVRSYPVVTHYLRIRIRKTGHAVAQPLLFRRHENTAPAYREYAAPLLRRAG